MRNGPMLASYERLPDIIDDAGEVTLSASYTAGNGIRIGLLDTESEDPNWREFDFTAEQAIEIGKALIRWGECDHGFGGAHKGDAS